MPARIVEPAIAGRLTSFEFMVTNFVSIAAIG